MNASPVAGLNEKLDIGVHERNGHGDGVAIWKYEVRVLAEALDCVEDVVPSTAVKSGRMIAEFVDDLSMCQCKLRSAGCNYAPRPSQRQL